MNALIAAALELERFFEARAWRCCFIGGLAVQRWGEPRLTLDVGCTLLTGLGQEESINAELRQRLIRKRLICFGNVVRPARLRSPYALKRTSARHGMACQP